MLYSSCDEPLLRMVVARFRERTSIDIRVVGDTEATKTIGLMQRLLAEKQNPRADVWWSNELLSTLRLDKAGLLDPNVNTPALAGPGDRAWPEHLRSPAGTWHAFALRARVIAFHTQRIGREQAPTTLASLTQERWRGRVGMARAQFGTTRTQMAAIAALDGEAALGGWLRAMRENRVKLYDGNSSVVRAIAQREIDLGLTDTDDVYAGIREAWPVDMVYESVEDALALPGGDGLGDRSSGVAALPRSRGPLTIPNSVAKIANGPNPEHARTLIDFLLSPEVERLLAESDSRNTPIHPEVAKDFLPYTIPDPMMVEGEKLLAADDGAQRIVETELRGM
ncbi:MAG: ABC transporter substrate-binding protein [Planctomycetota bacterium]|nr:ABC transporter substrate-binding protein [Planctomycetota bacterium]